MGNKGSKTTVQTNAPNAQAMAAYQDVLSRATAAASKPYQAYTGETTAPINAQQTLGIGNINSNAGFATPYVQSGAEMISSAGTPINASDIAQYMDPYTGQVIQATQADFDVQNQRANSTVTGNAAAQGALGGDRVGVAQALTQEAQNRVQAPVIAGLRSSGYQSAVNTAENEKLRQAQAGSGLVSAGVAGQNAALTGANAQVAAGTLQQQTQQAQDTASMQEYLRAQGYDFQTAQYLAGIAGSMGSLMGGTNTTQGPTPNPWSQVAGLGIAALGAFSDERLKENIERVGELDDGQPIYRYNFKGDPKTQIGLLAQKVERKHPEAVGVSGGYRTVDYKKATEDAADRWSGGAAEGYAEGGMPYAGVAGYVPTISNLVHGNTTPQGAKAADPGKTDYSGMAKGLGAIGNKMKGLFNTPMDISSPEAGFSPTSVGDYGSSGVAMPSFDVGGQQSYIYRDGGGVRGFATDGRVSENVEDLPPFNRPVMAGFGTSSFLPWDDRVGDTALGSEPKSSDRFNVEQFQAYGDNRTKEEERSTGWNPGFRTDPYPQTQEMSYAPTDGGVQPTRSIVMPPGSATPGVGPETTPLPRPRPPMTQQQAEADVPRPPAPVPQQSAGVAASPPSPQESKLLGLFSMSPELRQGMIVAGLSMMANRHGGPGSFLAAAGEGGIAGVGAYNKAASDAREAEQTEAKMKFEREKFERPYSQMTLAQRAQFDKDKTPEGFRSIGDRMEPIPGGPKDPDYIKSTKAPNAMLDDADVEFMAKQFLAGDRTVLQNLGRGAQGAENVIKVRQAIRKAAEDAGMSPAQLAVKMAEYQGMTAGQRALGTRIAQNEMAIYEAQNMLPIARSASAKVGRTRWVPVNKAVQYYETNSGDPDIKEFGMANFSLVNSYVRAISPLGVPPESLREHAYKILNTADSPEAYERTLQLMEKEMEAAQKSPQQVKEKFRKLYGGQETPKQEEVLPPEALRALKEGAPTTFKNGQTWTLKDGKPVRVK